VGLVTKPTIALYWSEMSFGYVVVFLTIRKMPMQWSIMVINLMEREIHWSSKVLATGYWRHTADSV
jgi:hypothetical protein